MSFAVMLNSSLFFLFPLHTHILSLDVTYEIMQLVLRSVEVVPISANCSNSRDLINLLVLGEHQ